MLGERLKALPDIFRQTKKDIDKVYRSGQETCDPGLRAGVLIQKSQRTMNALIRFISSFLFMVAPITIASEPPSLLVDKGACPYEGCSYGTWTTEKPANLRSSPEEDSPIVGSIEKGESVQALTGEVHVTPSKFLVSKPYGKYKEGDVLWVYTYVGEGMFKVWFRGGTYNEDLGFSPHGGSSGSRCEASAECWGELEKELQSTWWVQVKTSEGVTGWTSDTQQFERTSLGGLSPTWHGAWESEDGKSSMTITAKRIVVSELRDLPGEMPEHVSYAHDWSNAQEANGDNPLTFGYSSAQTSRRELKARFEKAVAMQNRDSAGVFQIRDAAMARRLIDALSPGAHEKIWAYGEGDFDVKFVVDGDSIVEIDDNMYGFGLRKFSRVAGSAKQTEESQGNLTQSDKIKVKDGSTLVGALKDATVPFTSSFGSVEVDLREVRSFGEGKLSLADGTVLNGQFGEKELEITTGRGDLTIHIQDIVNIARGSAETHAADTSVRLAPGQGVLTGRVLDNFRKPVRGASVRIKGSALQTTTDQDGKYQLNYVPGAVLVQIERSGYDPVQFALNLSEPAQYPVEDKTLLRLPHQLGVFYWDKEGWARLEKCLLKQTNALSGRIDIAGVEKEAYQVSGSPLRIPSGGPTRFLDNTQSRGNLLIYRVDSNNEIVTNTRGGGLGGFAATLNPGQSKKGTSLAQYGKWEPFPGRHFYAGRFKPGVYAVVDRSYKKTCFKFQVGEVAGPARQPVQGTPSEADTLTVDGKSVRYWRSPSHEKHANFRFESEGYRNTYLLDCRNKRFLWTENIRVSTGTVTGNSGGAEWRPMNPKSAISNAVYDAICPSVLSGHDEASAEETAEHDADIDRYVGVWSYEQHGGKQYFKVEKKSGNKVEFVKGVDFEGDLIWPKTYVEGSDGIYLTFAQNRLDGQFTSSNFYATHGKNFTYKITLTSQPDEKLTYSVWSSIRDGETDERVAKKISD